ncbi:histidine kinase dimerization/phosphoacceptor domain -containing protein [Limobrevibacterium gyesilva]|uniref:Sensor histidine kinase n=1 Tax=Limobrevibacterium gyesilva TaxID=2991712 RepID=A0AA41YJL0_9PROT|nr:sensor histidine kinase [Limobrevibacterium gyesilva]MCW3474891.1 sensor histidine kinase [Limobrevibacterium gyesilva]
MPKTESLLRELNHRVKNNFQVIVSLMNLKKRMLPVEQREDLRFIEEHVQSMAVAYRLVYATGEMVEVSVADLITDVISGLQQIAGLAFERVEIDVGRIDASIGLDQAIALGLYLAVVAPPYLDHAKANRGTVRVNGDIEDGLLTVSLKGSWSEQLPLDFLRSRLMRAYIEQLQAEMLSSTSPSDLRLRFRRDPGLTNDAAASSP